MEVHDITSLNLNDSEIVQTLITRTFEIEVLLNYILDYSSQETALMKLVFQDCHSATLQLNLAFEGSNSILSGQEVPAKNGYRKFTIETNTTASVICITAKHLRLVKCDA